MTEPSTTSSYAASLDYLFARVTGGWKMGLERTTELLSLLGDPHTRVRAFHVAGTNGKGSVISTLEALLRGQGLRVGKYTSPHLIDFRERIAVNGVPMSEEDVVEFIERWTPDVERLGATFFEATTAMAFDHFVRENVDVAVIEVGLGGRLDSTNVITPVAAAVSSIGIDHVQYLGDTLELIAREKAGIFKRGVPAVIGEGDPQLRAFLASLAREAGASPVLTVADEWAISDIAVALDGTRFALRTASGARQLHTPLIGRHQAMNAATALAMLECAGHPYAAAATNPQDALARVRIAGRFQSVGSIIFDVAHNPAGCAVLCETLQAVRPTRPLTCLMTALRDKDWHAMMTTLAPFVDRFVLASPPSVPADRAWALSEALAFALESGWNATAEPDFDRALADAREGAGTTLITGSFHTVGDAMARLQVSPLAAYIPVMSPGALPGFRDFYPTELAERSYIFRGWREVARRYGFVEYDGPPLEPLDLYTKKSGAEIVDQLYNFKDKGDREIALRPEMTPTLARMVAARANAMRKPVRWFSIPQLFRYERQQRGRLREHFQLNMDIIGEADASADAELLASAIDVMRTFELTSDDVVARVSDRRLLNALLRGIGITESQMAVAYATLDKLDRDPRDVLEHRLATGGVSASTSAQLFELAGSTADEAAFTQIVDAAGATAEWDNLRRYLDHTEALGVRDWVRLDLSIVRGLAYYTGIVFELFDAKGELRAICGGGRYDTLLESLGGVSLPALGFGMGDVVLGELLKSRGKMPAAEAMVDIWVAYGEAGTVEDAMRVAAKLRARGRSVEYALGNQKLARQLKAAHTARARETLVIATPELSAGEAMLRKSDEKGERKVLLDAWLEEI